MEILAIYIGNGLLYMEILGFILVIAYCIWKHWPYILLIAYCIWK